MNTKLLSASENDLKTAANIIRSGGTVVFPTETVYGLGADARNSEAVKNIFKAKGRPGDNPLIVHIYDIKQLNGIVKDVPENAKKLMDKFWPGPLTIILKKGNDICSEVTAGMDTVGIRMPKDEVAHEFLKLADIPVAAPSANLSGKPSPTTYKHCVEDMNGRVDAIIDGGECCVGVESTVIDLSAKPIIYRPGDITKEEIESFLNCEVEMITSIISSEKPKSPGLKYKHYAPKAQVKILHGSVEQIIECVNSTVEKVGVLLFDEHLSLFENKLKKDYVLMSLGKNNNPKDAEKLLFKLLRDMDENDVKVIFAPEISSSDKWAAVKNRLYRAAGNIVTNADEYLSGLHEKSKSQVLFVCTGNTCRSPMAEGLFNNYAKDEGLKLTAGSAGLYVTDKKTSENSILVLGQNKIDISNHIPTQLTKVMIENAKLILTLSKSHKEHILSVFPKLTNVYTISEFVGENLDVTDPYGGNMQIYNQCFLQIKDLIKKVILKLKSEENND